MMRPNNHSGFLSGALCLLFLFPFALSESTLNYVCSDCTQPVGVAGFSCIPGLPSSCSWTGCDAGFSDCNSVASDGCEISTDSDPINCGTCGTDCSTVFLNANTNCSNSECVLDSCLEGFSACGQSDVGGCISETCPDCATHKSRKKENAPSWELGQICFLVAGDLSVENYTIYSTDPFLSDGRGNASVQDNKLVLEFTPNRSGNATFTWVLQTVNHTFPITLSVEITNAKPTAAFHKYEWNAYDGVPELNLLDDCVDNNGDPMQVMGLACNPLFLKYDCYNVSDYELYFDSPAHTFVEAYPNGTLNLFYSHGTTFPNVTYGAPIDNFWARELSFFYSIWDFDVDVTVPYDKNSVTILALK